MKKTAIAVFLGILAMLAAGPGTVRAQTLLLDYVGYDYEDTDPDSTLFGEVGSGYVGLGDVVELFSPLVSDTANNEYTYVFSGLTSTSRVVVGPFIIVTYSSPGVLSVYEDLKLGGTHRDFGTYPPNATAPSTFTDGTLYLQGDLTGFQFIFNTGNGTGSYEANFKATGGSNLNDLPLNQRDGWTFAGATENAASIPLGYRHHQIDGQVFLNEPVPTKASSWGRIKASYR